MTIAELSERFRIPSQLLELAGVRFFTDADVRDLIGIHGRTGQDLSGIVFPCRDPRDGRAVGHCVRLGMPISDGQKYLSEQGCRALFFHQLAGAN